MSSAYMIIKKTTMKALMEEVNALFDKGYECAGGVAYSIVENVVARDFVLSQCSYYEYFVQAMYLPAGKEKK